MIVHFLLATITHWVVPATGEEQFLPDRDPVHAQRGGVVRLVAAQGEYEPGSFVVRSDVDLGKVQLSVGALTNAHGRAFPAQEVDLKVVKVWYQNNNGWFSYFGDTGGFKLCPELLLNDEDLVRVDPAKTANYARLTDADGRTTGERWINPPRQMDVGSSDWRAKIKSVFQPMKPEFRDAETLQPVALGKDVRKQFFLTAHVPKGTPAGTYRGSVRVGSAASVPVEIRVLDFALPRPKTYFKPEKDFLVTAFNYLSLDIVRELNGGDLALAQKQFKAILANEARHGVQLYPLPGGISSETDFYIRTMQEVGMRTDVLRGGARALRSKTWKGSEDKVTYADMVADAKRQAAYYDRTLGHHNIYVFHGDEPSTPWIAKERPLVDAYHEAGLKYFIACHRALFHKGGHVWDFNSTSKSPNDDSTPRLWNQMDGEPYVGWYGHMHVGNENPAHNRRQNGLAPYLSGYSALCNYAFHLGPWNDDSTTYKPMVNAYGVYGGVIDTLQWEGFREGVDDIRYATLLTALARKALKSADCQVRREGRKALHYMAELKMGYDDYLGTGCDPLDTVRLEMIRLIENLRAKLGADGAYEEEPIVVRKFVGESTEPLDGKHELYGEQSAARFRDWAFIAAHADKTLASRRERPHALGRDHQVQAYVQAYLVTGARDKAIALCREVALFRPLADLLEGRPPVWSADPKTATRQVELAGACYLVLDDEEMVRKLQAVKTSLVRPRVRKTYPVACSAVELVGLGGWSAASVRPPAQPLDRKFGGNMDFLTTDVISGDRGADVGKDASAEGAAATVQVVCDRRGLHFRFDEKNPDARALGDGAKGGGTFECYLAPGPNTPYVSFIVDQATGRLSLFNTTYDTYGLRAVSDKGPHAARVEVGFGKDVATTYVFIPWNAYAAQLPEDGDEWEFEVVFWNRRGGTCWNGTESIHGRSTWGRLRFSLGEEARAGIVLRQLFAAKKTYEREKVTWDSGIGILDFCQDADLGDAAFYAAKVKPLVAALDAAAEGLSYDLPVAEIFRYEREVLPKWRDIRFIVADLRRDWLLDRMGSKGR